jgi:hypothetical protein
MPKYLFAYHGSSIPKIAADNPELMTAWLDWMDQLGDALEGNINPMITSKTIGPDGTVSDDAGRNAVVGLSFVTAEDMAAAVRIARSCPHLGAGGSIEIGEPFKVKRDRS